ncbi:MAG TPA: M28 family peptidase [Holophaga sp.]|nr:M28 family peptidase [Holophaga sp.]
MRILLPFLSLALVAAPPAEVRLRQDLERLASPALGGRGNGDATLDQAMDYMAAAYRKLGLEPKLQRYAWVARVKRQEAAASLGGKALAWGTDMEAAGYSADADLKGLPLRFVGCGLKAGAYDDLGDLKGKAALLFRRLPEAAAFAQLKRADTGLLARIRACEAAGAAAILLVEEGEAPRALSREEGPTSLALPVLSLPAKTLAPWMDLAALRAKIVETGQAQAVPEPDAKLDLKLALKREEVQMPNLAVLLPGKDPARQDQVIVVGGHLDHLGHGERHSSAGEAGRGQVHPGADDNGSGSVLTLELARRFAAQPASRPILFLHFSAEEEGLLGSTAWVRNPTLPLSHVKFMVNLDMVGRLDPAKPTLLMGGLGAPKAALERARSFAPPGLALGTDVGAAVGGSDHMSFSAARIPTFFFFTGLHKDYHKPTDTADRINYAGMVQVEEMVAKVVRDLADGAEVPAFDPETAKIQSSRDSAPMAVSLGVLPDFTENQLGFRITDTSRNSAAEAAGMKGGDIIVAIAGKPVKSIYDYMAVLSGRKPGDKVLVEWLRDGAKMSAEATLKAR